MAGIMKLTALLQHFSLPKQRGGGQRVIEGREAYGPPAPRAKQCELDCFKKFDAVYEGPQGAKDQRAIPCAEF